jgi:Double zinc ribbon
MKCPSCGSDNREGAKFCGECAAPLTAALACRSCGTANPKGRKFCDSCGQPLAEPSAPDPRSYTPKHLAEKILTSRSALEGERKQVTVLFADLKGSMDLSESIDPEDWHRIMERFFTILTDGVHRFEGTVNQYTGDGIMGTESKGAAAGSVYARATGKRLIWSSFPHRPHTLALPRA